MSFPWKPVTLDSLTGMRCCVTNSTNGLQCKNVKRNPGVGRHDPNNGDWYCFHHAHKPRCPTLRGVQDRKAPIEPLMLSFGPPVKFQHAPTKVEEVIVKVEAVPADFEDIPVEPKAKPIDSDECDKVLGRVDDLPVEVEGENVDEASDEETDEDVDEDNDEDDAYSCEADDDDDSDEDEDLDKDEPKNLLLDPQHPPLDPNSFANETGKIDKACIDISSQPEAAGLHVSASDASDEDESPSKGREQRPGAREHSPPSRPPRRLSIDECIPSSRPLTPPHQHPWTPPTSGPLRPWHHEEQQQQHMSMLATPPTSPPSRGQPRQQIRAWSLLSCFTISAMDDDGNDDDNDDDEEDEDQGTDTIMGRISRFSRQNSPFFFRTSVNIPCDTPRHTPAREMSEQPPASIEASARPLLSRPQAADPARRNLWPTNQPTATRAVSAPSAMQQPSPATAHHRTSAQRQSELSYFASHIPDWVSEETYSKLCGEYLKPVDPSSREAGYIHMYSPGREVFISSQESQCPKQTQPRQPTSSKRPDHVIRIGLTKAPDAQVDEQVNHCGFDLQLLRSYPYNRCSKSSIADFLCGSPMRLSSQPRKVQTPVPRARLVEQLVHIELADRQLNDRFCGIEACAARHGESFAIDSSVEDLKKVDKVIRRWVAWAEARHGSGL